MTFKEEIKKTFEDKKELTAIRSSSSKIMFLLFVLIFFLVFYFVWAGIWENFLPKLISPLYFLMILSLNIFIFFLGQKLFPIKKIYAYILSWVFALASIFFLLPLFI